MATMSYLLLVTFLSLLISVSYTAPTSVVTPTVTVDSGPVVGTTTSLSGASVIVTKYLGIPFAASPTRFAPAARPTSWQTPLNATNYGPACVQQFNYPEAARNRTIAFFNTPPPPAGESEDCLNLNVYVPGSSGKNKTVMVWIYGGSLTFGSNSAQAYDGTGFAANQDVILVSINYRTNVFGFPNSPELPLTKRNLGYTDQRFALDWIQRNIGSFGGDPKKVTIFGESAGAASVDTLVTTYPKNPPFRAAIMQSGQTTLYTNLNNNAPTSWLALASALNCSQSHPQSNLTCLRSFPASVIKSTIEHLALAFTPVSDNSTNLRYPAAARVNGSVAPVPILTGNNADEGSIFVAGAGGNASQYLSALIPNQPALVASILSAYPNTTRQLSDILTDSIFQCPAGIAANDTVTGGNKAWRYYFNATFANTQLAPGLGVYHSSEIPIVWGTYPRVNATDGEARLSAAMQASWANFAKNPNQGGAAPGFAGVPTVGVWGNGVGVNGDGSGRLNSTVSSGVLDRRCALYRPLYVAQGLATAGGGR